MDCGAARSVEILCVWAPVGFGDSALRLKQLAAASRAPKAAETELLTGQGCVQSLQKRLRMACSGEQRRESACASRRPFSSSNSNLESADERARMALRSGGGTALRSAGGDRWRSLVSGFFLLRFGELATSQYYPPTARAFPLV